MSSNIANAVLAVISVAEGEFDFQYTAIDENGDDVVFDENGDYYYSSASQTSWDNAPRLPVVSDATKYSKVLEKIIDGLEKVLEQLKDPPDDSEFGSGEFDLWIDINCSQGHFIINGYNGQVLVET